MVKKKDEKTKKIKRNLKTENNVSIKKKEKEKKN